MPPTPPAPASTSGKSLLGRLLDWSIILPEQFQELPSEVRAELTREADRDLLLRELSRLRLLTGYQVERILAGKARELVLGNYRLLHLLGSGGMGSVFAAEHVRLRQPAAIKVLALPPLNHLEPLLVRFLAEMRAVAQLQHPNIVAAKDAGEMAPDDPDAATLHYFVMEFVPGQDLEEYVAEHGPMPVAQVCDVIYQIASALTEAHQHQLIHRDVKPSNIILTPEGHAKLLDFGLARHALNRLTEPGMVLGTVDYMAPEQARDSSHVDGRTDLFALGGVMYWCLTGRRPFPRLGNNVQSLLVRLHQEPPSARHSRPDLPAELDELIARMMANDPAQRFPTAHDLMQGLLRFLPAKTHATLRAKSQPQPEKLSERTPVVLLVDDEAGVRTMSRMILEGDGWACLEAADGLEALETVQGRHVDLLVVDVDMPRMGGVELLKRLRAAPPVAHLKIIMMSGRSSSDEMAQLMLDGADDYLTKPFGVAQFRARSRSAWKLKAAQDRAAELTQRWQSEHAELERALAVTAASQAQLRQALILSLSSLMECRNLTNLAQQRRGQHYCRALAETLAADPALANQLTREFTDGLVALAPLRDLGKIGLPDDILNKPGQYDAEELQCMRMHTVMGGEVLRSVIGRHGAAVDFLFQAIDIVRHHHERWDGSGYPDGLCGEQIPLAARLVAVVDVYDALRTRKPYRPGFTHALAVQVITASSPGQFDPRLVAAFTTCAPRFEAIFADESAGFAPVVPVTLLEDSTINPP